MTYTIEEIKDGLLSGRQEVFRYLYRTYGGMIVGYVRKNSGTDTDAREMVQTVLLEFWQAIKENRYQDEGKLDRYLYMLTANTWRDELRRRKTRKVQALSETEQQFSDDAELSVAAAIVKDRRIEAIHHCLNLLEAPCDDMIRLFHLQEVSLLDMARQMQYDYNNLRKRIFDCRKKLKKLVDTYLIQTT